jgi:hypothetical protein
MVRGEESPEDLLPATTQLYLRWDGIAAHRAAYQKTALGQMLRGDTGKFLAAVYAQLQAQSGTLLSDRLLQGAKPEVLEKTLADAAQAPKLLEWVGTHGFLFGLEMVSLEPPRVQGTLILPQAGTQPDMFTGTLGLITGLMGVESKEITADGRTVRHADTGAVHLTWWLAGPHAVLVVGSDAAQEVVKRVYTKSPRLSANLLYQKLQAFHQFETAARGYVDVTAPVKLTRKRHPQIAKILDTLGLAGLNHGTFYIGFDGEAGRSLFEADFSGPAKGLFRMFSGKPFPLTELPPLPQDITSWSMSNLDLAALWGTVTQTYEDLVQVFAPDSLAEVRDGLKKVEDALGADFSRDLLASLGQRLVLYNASAEGPLVFGQTVLVQVRDAKKCQEIMIRLARGLGRIAGVEVNIKKETYHGAEVRQILVRQEGFIFVPTFTVYKGWLALSLYPQAVKGYILRANGALPAWKPDEQIQAAFAHFPRECVSVSVSDPRPTVRQLLALAPLVAGAVRSFLPESKFDVGTVPNAYEATKYLFPNVSVMSWNGNTLRKELRGSLELPFELGGIDSYPILLYLFAGFAFRLL